MVRLVIDSYLSSIIMTFPFVPCTKDIMQIIKSIHHEINSDPTIQDERKVICDYFENLFYDVNDPDVIIESIVKSIYFDYICNESINLLNGSKFWCALILIRDKILKYDAEYPSINKILGPHSIMLHFLYFRRFSNKQEYDVVQSCLNWLKQHYVPSKQEIDDINDVWNVALNILPDNSKRDEECTFAKKVRELYPTWCLYWMMIESYEMQYDDNVKKTIVEFLNTSWFTCDPDSIMGLFVINKIPGISEDSIHKLCSHFEYVVTINTDAADVLNDLRLAIADDQIKNNEGE